MGLVFWCVEEFCFCFLFFCVTMLSLETESLFKMCSCREDLHFFLPCTRKTTIYEYFRFLTWNCWAYRDWLPAPDLPKCTLWVGARERDAFSSHWGARLRQTSRVCFLIYPLRLWPLEILALCQSPISLLSLGLAFHNPRIGSRLQGTCWLSTFSYRFLLSSWSSAMLYKGVSFCPTFLCCQNIEWVSLCVLLYCWKQKPIHVARK